MTPEKINQAIAELVGWTMIEPCKTAPGLLQGWINPKPAECWYRKEDGSGLGPIPNYFADLNACREMRQSVSEDERGHYCSLLDATIRQRQTGAGEWDLLDATAPDHCRTFLRLKGKWVE
jgi:hypothetical protein